MVTNNVSSLLSDKVNEAVNELKNEIVDELKNETKKELCQEIDVLNQEINTLKQEIATTEDEKKQYLEQLQLLQKEVDKLKNNDNNANENTINGTINSQNNFVKISNEVNINNIGLNVDERIFSGKEYDILSVFPNITLEEVQLLSADATLEDSVDWYVIMKMIDFAQKNKVGYIRLPQGKAIISRTIDLTKRLYRCTISGCNVEIQPSKKQFVGNSLIKLSNYDNNGTNHSSSRMVHLDSLFLNGTFTNGIIGVEIKQAQEWLITNSTIRECFIGVSIVDSWYGEMSLENVIQDCIRGIEFKIGIFNEVNTIKFNNVKINTTLNLESRKRLSSLKDGETEEEYKLRVPTVGIRFRTKVGGVEFNGCVIEGQEIGFLAEGRTIEEDGSLGTYGNDESILNIDNCYLEAIKRKFYHIASISQDKLGINQICFINISNVRHHGNPSEESFFDAVRLSVRNCQRIHAKIGASVTSSIVYYNDSWIIEKEDERVTQGKELLAINNDITSVLIDKKFKPFGNNGSFPGKEDTYANIQDGHSIVMYHPVSNVMCDNHKMLQATNVSQVFIPSIYSKNGVVLKGDDGNYYMIQINVNGEIVPRKIKDIYTVLPPSNSLSNVEMWKRRKEFKDTSVYWCGSKEFLYYEENNGYEYFYRLSETTGEKRPRIMTYKGYLERFNLGLFNSSFIHIIDLNITISSKLYFIDWYGREHEGLKCVGTLTERPKEVPTEAVDFKYIATDEDKIYAWNGFEYKEFIPYNVK